MKFIFVSGVTIPYEVQKDENVFIHLSMDNFQPDYLQPEGKGVYSSTRMVPPGPLTYFYSIEGKPYQSLEKPVISTMSPITVDVELITGEKSSVSVPKTNIIDNVVQTRQLITGTYLSTLEYLPRPPPKNIPRKTRQKTPWSIARSIFAKYKIDTQDLLNQCLEQLLIKIN